MTDDNKPSRETILNYVSRVIKYGFVGPLKHSRMKIELTFDSVKWVLRRCGDLDKYIFEEIFAFYQNKHVLSARYGLRSLQTKQKDSANREFI